MREASIESVVIQTEPEANQESDVIIIEFDDDAEPDAQATVFLGEDLTAHNSEDEFEELERDDDEGCSFFIILGLLLFPPNLGLLLFSKPQGANTHLPQKGGLLIASTVDLTLSEGSLCVMQYALQKRLSAVDLKQLLGLLQLFLPKDNIMFQSVDAIREFFSSFDQVSLLFLFSSNSEV